MVSYFNSLVRETVLPRWFGRTHPRWHSPYTASLVQSAFSIVVILFLAAIFQKTNADGSTSYAFVLDRKSTRLNSSHVRISYAVFCLQKKQTSASRSATHP